MQLNIIRRCGAVLFAAAITLLTLKTSTLAGPGFSGRSDNGVSINRHGSDDPSGDNNDRGRGRGGPGKNGSPTPSPTASPTATPSPTPDDDDDGDDDDGMGHH